MTGRSTLRERQLEFVRKHGFSFKAYAIALAVMPPAAIYIAFKMAHLPLPMRIGAALFVIAVHAALGLGGAALLIKLFS